MPTIEFSKRDLESLMSMKIEDSSLERFFLTVKGELDGYENGIIKLDVKDTNRPDLWSVEGIARELKLHYGNKFVYPFFDFSGYSVKIDKKVKKIRPFAAYAVVRNVNIDENFLKSLIQLQEKIALSYGNKRKEVAIGLFKLDKIKGKNLLYTADKGISFVPLGCEKEMKLEDVLKNHPKGKEYAYILKDFDCYPVLLDESKEIVSFPPIINSAKSGKLDVGNYDLLIDVTGTIKEKVDLALLIFALVFTERNYKVESVKIIDDNTYYTPYIEKKEIEFNKEYFYEYLGEDISDEEIKNLLSKKAYEVLFKDNKIIAYYPSYRADIMHYADVIEDLLIEKGYNTMPKERMLISSTASFLDETKYAGLIRDLCIGASLQEVMTFTLTSYEKHFLAFERTGNALKIANPVSKNLEYFRDLIMPNLLEFLSKNQHRAYPQRIFEFGRVVNNNAKEEWNLSVAISYEGCSYTDARQVLDFILYNIGAKKIKYEKKDYGFFIKGRSAELSFEFNGKDCKGIVGEIDIKVLKNFNMETPVVAFEISLLDGEDGSTL